MSFIYPRTISITRPGTIAGVGAQGYSGAAAANETSIAANIPASIQLERQGPAALAGVPADTIGRGLWRIYFKLPRGTVQERDIITDDLGNRFQVTNPYWDSLGYNVTAETLKN